MAVLVDGNEIARRMRVSVKEKIEDLRGSVKSPPRLVSLLVGRPEEAKIYVKMQEKAAKEVGIEFATHELGADISQEELLREIEKLNADETVTAIIAQKPLPEGMKHDRVVEGIAPEKDAEGIHPRNLGKILRREADIVPCTPGAVMKILSEQDLDLYGKEAVMIGHSAIVGKPLSLMLMNEMATTTVCHIATSEKGDLAGHVRKADILIVAAGCPELVKGNWIKEGAVVIDVGINRVDGKIVGDVDFAGASERASVITPVPGGVGPVTVSVLMRNVLRAYKKQNAGD